MRKAIEANIFEALQPFVKNLEPDGVVTVHGPSKDKHYTAVAGVTLKDGKAVEKSMRDLVNNLPEAPKSRITLDADKIGGISISRITIKDASPDWMRNFGDAPLYVAFRSDVLLAGAGEHGLKALKEALAAQPEAALPLQVSLSIARLGEMSDKNQEAISKASKTAFAQDKGSDRVLFTIQGGDALKVRLDMKLAIVTFLSEMEKATKEGK